MTFHVKLNYETSISVKLDNLFEQIYDRVFRTIIGKIFKIINSAIII